MILWGGSPKIMIGLVLSLVQKLLLPLAIITISQTTTHITYGDTTILPETFTNPKNGNHAGNHWDLVTFRY